MSPSVTNTVTSSATPGVTVYSKPDCAQCAMTLLALDRAGVRYAVVDLAQDDAARAYVMDELGYSAAPVVVVDGVPAVHWSGFRRERIAALVADVGRVDPDEPAVRHGDVS